MLRDDFDDSLDQPVEISHQFEVDLNCLVTINHKITIEGINRKANEEVSAIEANLSDETDRETVRSLLWATENDFDDLKLAARNLAMVALVTRLHHWATALQIALSAARFGCLADDRMLRLLSVQLYRVPVSSLRGQGHQLHPTCLAGRGRNHAMADNHGREGTALGGNILITH
jgi:hypothetical protein